MSGELEHRIARDFVVGHPAEAARALEGMANEALVDFSARLDPEAGARLLEAMVAHRSVAALGALPDAQAAEALAAMPARVAATLLRSVARERRGALLARVPAKEKAAVERILRYPAGTAGSIMEPQVAAFHHSRTVGDVVRALSDGTAAGLRFYVYVVGDAEELLGCLSVRELGEASTDDHLSTVMHKPVESIPARSGHAALVNHPAWSRLPVLPVVDEVERLVGVLRYETFRTLERETEDEARPSPVGMALALSELFWFGATGLFRGMGEERAAQALGETRSVRGLGEGHRARGPGEERAHND